MSHLATQNALVTVVVPAYNAAATIKRTLESVLGQTYAHREIIVVDDGSTDSTSQVLDAFGEKIQVLKQRNQGPAAARNVGLDRARGEFLAFLDADDLWHSEFLQSCLGALLKRSDLVAVSTGGKIADANGSYRSFPAELIQSSTVPLLTIENFFEFWSAHDHIRTGNCVIRREPLIGIGGQNDVLRLAEDLELWALLGTCGKWAFIPDVLWICESVPATIIAGWNAKYRDRRRLAPTVDQWQERILPRLNGSDVPGFKQIRGKVAAILAHNNILGGHAAVARAIVATYGREMPQNWSVRLMKCALRLGQLSWLLAVGILRCREAQKSFLLRHGKGFF